MNRSIGYIAWPGESCDSVQLLLLYMLRVIERLGINFNGMNFDPLDITMRRVSGEDVSEVRKKAIEYWWGFIDERGVRDFQNKDLVMGRLAICLLAPDAEKNWSFGDQVSWFIEVIGLLGLDSRVAVELMRVHFQFSEDLSS